MTTEMKTLAKKQRPQKWNKCLNEGYSLILGGSAFGGVASLVTRSLGPLLVMTSIALFAAVENCDNVFGHDGD
ncbi:hypothetical protein J6590_011472 [Homalodisca vitripennis]|nr:hypothetical protein J6590_011472 [Homalodisca vitripennis]